MKPTIRFLMSSLLLAACTASAGKTDPQEDFSDLGDVKSDSFSRRWNMVGAIESDKPQTIQYANPPRFQAWTYNAVDGDALDVRVHSEDGDSIAWLLDSSKRVVTSNDDSDGTTDSHLVANHLHAGVYYVVVRDYYLQSATFTLTADRTNAIFGCSVDADCVAVQRGCCGTGWKEAVDSGREADYRAALECPADQICPLYVINDTRTPICNARSQCQMVQPFGMHCGGFIRNAHQCTGDYSCRLNRIPDVGGICVPATFQTCGGIGGRQCDAGFGCVDDPADSCNPASGGADCGGICVPN
jgi:hypothetical protein